VDLLVHGSRLGGSALPRLCLSDAPWATPPRGVVHVRHKWRNRIETAASCSNRRS
jgi:hypothetical protein